MVLVQAARAAFTVLPTGVSLPFSPILRFAGSLHTTLKIFSRGLPSLPSQPLTIWMRSRLPPIGSLSAATRKVGALPLGAAFRSPPIGTPLVYPAMAGLRVLASD